MLILSNEDMEKIFTMKECLNYLEIGYRELGEGRALNFRRQDCYFKTKKPDTYYVFKTMGGGVQTLGVTAIRLNSDTIHWPVINGMKRRVKIPAAPGGKYVGLVYLFSIENGEPLAIFPDGVVQATRVAGASGLGSKYMARQNVSTAALLGAGWQARKHLLALSDVRSGLKQIRVYCPTKKNRMTFVKEMSPLVSQEVIAVDTPEEAVKGADIIMCVTNSLHSVVKAAWLEEGVHLSSIRATEVDAEAIHRCDRIVVHSNWTELNYLVSEIDGNQVPELVANKQFYDQFDVSQYPDLASVVAGKATGRRDEKEITFFWNHIGMGFQFAAVGARIYELALEKGLGQKIPTDWFLETVHP